MTVSLACLRSIQGTLFGLKTYGKLIVGCIYGTWMVGCSSFIRKHDRKRKKMWFKVKKFYSFFVIKTLHFSSLDFVWQQVFIAIMRSFVTQALCHCVDFGNKYFP